MKQRLGLLLSGILAAALGLSAAEPDSTGNIFPTPQQIRSEFLALPDAELVEVQYDESSEPMRLAAELLRKSFSREGAGPAASRISVCFGLLDSPVVQQALPLYGEPADSLRQPEQGYAMRYRETAPGAVEVLVAGSDLKGAFYGVMSLRQLLKGNDFRIAAVDDFPIWPRRIVSDYTPAAGYQRLAEHKMPIFAWQWRDDFRKLVPDGDTHGYWLVAKIADAMKAIREEKARGLVDFALVLHLYMTQPQFNITKASDIEELAQRCRYAWENGIRTIYIGTDDHTKTGEGGYVCHYPEEVAAFGNSVGRAHGVLMRELQERLRDNCPGLTLGFIPAPYSLRDHAVDISAANQRYLRDFSAEAPAGMPVVWTGTHIYTTQLDQSDYQEFSRYLPHNPQLILWDNLEELLSPMPLWNAELYSGYERDAGGEFFANVHAFGWSWTFLYLESQNAYLWNPAAYDEKTAALEILTRACGKEHAEALWKLTRLFENARKARKEFQPEQEAGFLREALQAKELLDACQLDSKQILGYAQSPLDEAIRPRPTIGIPELSPTPPLLTDGRLDEKQWKEAASLDLGRLYYSSYYLTRDKVYLFCTADALHLAGEFEFQPDIERARAGTTPTESVDHFSFTLSPGGPEQLEFIVDAAGNTMAHGAGERTDTLKLPWECRVAQRGDHWYCEIAIPFSTLRTFFGTVPGAEGKAPWRGNLVHTIFNGYTGLTESPYQGVLEWK